MFFIMLLFWGRNKNKKVLSKGLIKTYLIYIYEMIIDQILLLKG